jgi:hypothetical protein
MSRPSERFSTYSRSTVSRRALTEPDPLELHPATDHALEVVLEGRMGCMSALPIRPPEARLSGDTAAFLEAARAMLAG